MENSCQIRIGRSTTGSNGIRAELRGEPAGYLQDVPTYKGRQDVTRINGNIMLVHSGFPNAKELLRTLSIILTYTLKNVRQPCPRPQKFEQYRFEGRQTVSLPGTLIYLEPALSGKQRVSFNVEPRAVERTTLLLPSDRWCRSFCSVKPSIKKKQSVYL